MDSEVLRLPTMLLCITSIRPHFHVPAGHHQHPSTLSCALQVITSKTHMVERKDSNGKSVMREEPVWNWAVANISLLAVGASSPE